MLTIRHLWSGGIIVNYACPSRCAHCLYRCGPHRPKDYIGEEMLRRVIRTVQGLGCGRVHIGGGEPFLDRAGLVRVVKTCVDEGLGLEYVETNASWFRDEASAVERLEELRAAGLTTLLVSISPFHNEHIPLRKTRGVLTAGRRAGMDVFPWVMGFFGELQELGEEETHRLCELEERFGPGYLARVPLRYWIHFGGRALETFGPVLGRKPVEAVLDVAGGACTELESTDHFHIDLYGSYVPGLCAGLAIRPEDLGAPLDEDRYPLISLLYREGVRGLLGWAVAEHGFSPREEGYLNKCDLCDHLRRFLVTQRGLGSQELQPPGFYAGFQ